MGIGFVVEDLIHDLSPCCPAINHGTRLRATNYNSSLLEESDKRDRSPAFFDWDMVCRWYNKNNLVHDLDRKDFLTDKLLFNPYAEKHESEAALRHLHTFRLDDETPLLKLRTNDISMR